MRFRHQLPAAVQPATQPSTDTDYVLRRLVYAEFSVAGCGSIHFARRNPEVPAYDFHRPIGQVAVLVVQEVQCWKQLPTIARELFAVRLPAVSFLSLFKVTALETLIA